MSVEQRPTRVAAMQVGLYRTTGNGSRRVGELILAEDGSVELVVLDPKHRRFLERLQTEGIASRKHQRVIAVAEGRAFLDAVLETLQSSYWRARDDAEPLPERVRTKRQTAAAI